MFSAWKKVAETIAILDAAYKKVMKETQVYKWFNCFKKGKYQLRRDVGQLIN